MSSSDTTDKNNDHPPESTSNVREHLLNKDSRPLRISPTDIGSIVKQGQSPLYVKLQGDSQTRDKIFDSEEWVEKSSLALLSTEGNEFEESVYNDLDYLESFDECECTDIKGDEDTDRLTVEESRERLREAIQEARLEDPEIVSKVRIFKQFPLQGSIGPFSVAGDSDMVCVFPKEGDGVEIRVFDIKASWSEKTSQQIQTSIYTMLIKNEFKGYLDELNVDISAGIIHKENKHIFEDRDDFPSLDELPEFNIEPREDDARRLLDEGSEMYKYITIYPEDDEGNLIEDPSVEQLLDTLDDLPFQIDSKSESSPYRDVRFTKAIENLDVAVLGVTRGTRKAMKANGIDDLRDLANLTEHKDDSDEYMDIAVNPEYEETVQELQREHGVQDIKDLSVQAKLYIGKLMSDDPDVDGMNQILPPKKDTYPKTLPDYERDDDINPDEGMKVFINPQYDYVSDTIVQLNAKVKPTDRSISGSMDKIITKTVEDIPIKDPLIENEVDTGRVDVEQAREYERELVREFTQDLLGEIEERADALNIEQNTVLHFYLYSEQEEQLLVDSMERHSHIESVDAFRNLLGVRDMGEQEQQLWGYIEDEIQRCYLVHQLPTFLPSMHDSFSGINRGSDGTGSWNYEYEGEEYQLNTIFSEQFFDYKREYNYEDGEVELTSPSEYTPNSSYTNEGTPVEAYTGAQLPLEYFWGCAEFDSLDETINMDDSDEDYNPYIQEFLYKYGTSQRIHKQDLSAFGSWVVDALDFIESNMDASYKVNKKPMDVSNISNYSLDSNSFDDSIEDYVQIEHESQKDDLLSEFQKPVSARVKSGKAIPMLVTDIEMTDSGYISEISGRLIYEEFGFDNPGFVKSSSKKDTGDYMVMSPFKKTSDGIYAATDQNGDELDPEDILNSPSVAITNFNTKADTIRLSVRNYGDNRRDLERGTATSNKYNQPVFSGQKVILDDQLSTFMLKHSLESLENSDRNKAYNVLDDTLHGDNNINDTNKFNSEEIDEFLEVIDEVDDDEIITPNDKQQDVVRSLAQICLLQGPPGTGKTSGALTSTLLSRIYANNDWCMNGLITGPSNTSVDELIEDVVDMLDLVTYHTDLSMDVSIYHLVSSSHTPSYPDDLTDNDNFNRIDDLSGSDARTLVERLENQQINAENTLVFGMPNMIKRLLEKQGHEYINAKPWFDLLVADEASMLTLPKIVMAGAYFDPNGQMVISGDHRQMSPVQSHEWEDETRPSIQKYIPYLSVLDYMRFLRGDELERIGYPDAHIESPNANIPLKQLEVTYRCHETIADFLQEWVYSADNIEYTSNETDTLSLDNKPKTEGLEAVLGDDPMVVITHSDTQSQESNVVESHIAEAIMEEIDTHNESYTEGDDEEHIDSGIVTPHSSQKGLLKDKNVSDEADTVERFQGGEKDMIMVSATVSDPAFIRKEDDFLLNPNRVNVAISRMKNKLIVIVPDSVFEHIPADVDVYDKSVIWNGLYNAVIDERGSEEWSGYLNDFVGENVSRGDVEVDVYTK